MAPRVMEKGPQLVQDEGLQQRPAFVLRRRVGQAARQRANDSSIEEIELALLHLPRRGLQLPGGQPVSDQGVRQDREVALHRPAVDAGIPGDGREVGCSSILAGRDLEEARKGAEVARKRFGLNFLHEVRFGIGAEVIKRIVAGHGHRERASRERPVNVEVERHLGRHQREQGRGDGPSREQVDATSAQLASAGAGEHEAQPAVFNEPMHFVQKLRDLLHLVDYRPGIWWQDRQFPVQVAGGLAQSQRLACVEQVVGGGRRKSVPNPGSLAGAPRAEQEDRTPGSGEESGVHCVLL